ICSSRGASSSLPSLRMLRPFAVPFAKSSSVFCTQVRVSSDQALSATRDRQSSATALRIFIKWPFAELLNFDRQRPLSFDDGVQLDFRLGERGTRFQRHAPLGGGTH